jgi:hypothetical protein
MKELLGHLYITHGREGTKAVESEALDMGCKHAMVVSKRLT